MPIRLAPRKPVAAKASVSEPSEIRLTLPVPISANRYWRTKVIQSKGRAFVQTYISTEAKQYKAAVRGIASLVCDGMFTGEVSIHVDVYRAAKRGDLDNMLKVLGDSLIGIAYVDDKQIVEIHARRFEDPKNPRVEVTIKKYFQENNYV